MEIKNVILEQELKNLILEKEGKLAIVTINRPKALNALNSETLKELDSAITNIENDNNIYCVMGVFAKKANNDRKMYLSKYSLYVSIASYLDSLSLYILISRRIL